MPNYRFLKKMNNKFMEFFESAYFLGAKKAIKKKKKKVIGKLK